MARPVIVDANYACSLVRQMEQSGMGVTDFCRENGIPKNRMYYCKSKCAAVMPRPKRVTPVIAVKVVLWGFEISGGFRELVIVFRGTRGKEAEQFPVRLVLPQYAFQEGKFRAPVLERIAETAFKSVSEHFPSALSVPSAADIADYCRNCWR